MPEIFPQVPEPHDDESALDLMIARRSLSYVLGMLSDVCAARAKTIRAISDRAGSESPAAARYWDHAAEQIETLGSDLSWMESRPNTNPED